MSQAREFFEAFEINARLLLWGSRLGHRLFPMGRSRPHYSCWNDGPQLVPMDNFLPGISIDLCAIVVSDSAFRIPLGLSTSDATSVPLPPWTLKPFLCRSSHQIWISIWVAGRCPTVK
jgi:hypothetical protein